MYAPNLFDSDFYNYMTELLSNMHDCAVIIGADMNATLNPDLDRSHKGDQHSQNKSSAAFQGLVSDFSLIDLFRVSNPSARQYTFFPIDTKPTLE